MQRKPTGRGPGSDNGAEALTAKVAAHIARELGGNLAGVTQALALLDGGATVPFIARYRKEATGGLDEVGVRQVLERAKYLRELWQRRAAVLAAISEQGKLSPDLRRAIEACDSKAELEELYAPYKTKRRTRGEIAKERGLAPLAQTIWERALGGAPASGTPLAEARGYVNPKLEVPDPDAALQGALDICAERIAEQPAAQKRVRGAVERGAVEVKKVTKYKQTPTKFDTYAGFSEPVSRIPSHRTLAILRGEAEGVLKPTLSLDEDRTLRELGRELKLHGNNAWVELLEAALGDSFSRLLLPAARTAVRRALKERAEDEAIEIFAKNLEQLLLAPPLGEAWVLGIDPGQRTGCKCVVVNPRGDLIKTALINLVQGPAALEQAGQVLHRLLKEYPIQAVAVGNGTHGRETEDFVRQQYKAVSKPPLVVSVNESGASVYSASDIAREEFPDQDITVRGAVSIARRLQDPLAELVKLEPQSIGVGQYQHDVSEAKLVQRLSEVVESAVNRVGVELNSASPSLLAYVSGIGPKLARKIVEHRTKHGAFKSRQALLSVSGLGAKTFELAAGFLRVRGGEHPLDGSAVHPERYSLVERIAKDLRLPLADLIGNAAALARIDAARYYGGDVGEYTMRDLLSELGRPGRDPRPAFEAPKFRDDVRTLEDVKEGMVLEGSVTNVTAFGAFVDIGVHQDGLVHVSVLADRFVKDPSEVVGVGDRIRVRVLGVDLARKRISLSARGVT